MDVIRGGVREKNTLGISSLRTAGYLSDDVKLKKNKADLDAVTRVYLIQLCFWNARKDRALLPIICECMQLSAIPLSSTAIKIAFDSLNMKYDLLLFG